MPTSRAVLTLPSSAAWQAHHAELRAYLTRRLSDPDGAADLLHDVYVKAMRQG